MLSDQFFSQAHFDRKFIFCVFTYSMKDRITECKMKLLGSIFFLLMGQSLVAQLQVINATIPPFTPENLVENTFLGNGVEVLSISYSGNNIAVGLFDGVNSNIGIGRGILMSTGEADTAAGQNAVGGTTGNTGGGSDPDLVSIANGNVNDASVYNIKFIPYADTLRFNYVFASEEYPEYAPPNVATFNDVFGFFISGPGINGTYTNNAENIALIPNTTQAVSINNINAVTNNGYYIDNTGGATVEFDAFTKVLTAQAVVVPCDTYDIKLAIADGGDDAWDSGVFLQAYSFGTNGLNFEVVTSSVDSTLAEGCDAGGIVFTLDDPADVVYPISYTITGTATNGVDYDFVPPTGFIGVGEDSLILNFNPIEDGMNEPKESIIIAIQTNPCETDTVILFIDENTLTSPSIDDAFICLGDSTSLDGTLNLPLPTNTVLSNNISVPIPDNDITNPALSTINVSNISPEFIIEESILSICVDITHPWTTDLDIFLITPGGQVLELATDIGVFDIGMNFTNTCFTLDATDLIFDQTAADAPYTGNYQPEGTWSDIFGGSVNGAWTLQVADDANGFPGTLNSWSITFPPTYSVDYSWTPNYDISCLDCPLVDVYPSVDTTYYVAATDSYGCTTVDSSLVSIISDLQAPVITCSTTGLTLTFEWGVVPAATGYQVNVDGAGWEPANGALSHSVTGVPGQTFTIEVQGTSASCGALIGTQTCSLPSCTFNALVDSTFNVSCAGGNDGSLYLTASNGAAPYEYTLDGTTQNNGSFTGLSEGTYTIQIADAFNCAAFATVTITEPDTLLASTSVSDVTCFAANDGTATVSASGGTPPYTYIWSTAMTTNSISSLSGGSYTITVTDANNCLQTANAFINEPQALGINLTGTNLTCNGIADGSLIATVSGGTPNYSYNWSTGASTSTINGLNAGNYMLTVTDDMNCLATAMITLTEPPAIQLTVSETLASCNGGADGTATVSASGGNGNYAYQWDANANNQGTPTATNLPFGNYTVTVSDTNGCFATAIANVGEQSSITYTLAATPVSCFDLSDGSVSANVSAGNGPFTYAWSTTPIQGNASLSNLPSGNYTITITDALGCSVVDNININSPSQVVLTTSTTAINCNGFPDGTATVTASGGMSGYTYLWNDALAQTTPTASGLAQGTYTVSVTDQTGCTANSTVSITEPSPLLATATGTDLTCFGSSDGSVTVTGIGGSTPYSYVWNYGTTSAIATGLSAGTCFVTVSDANGCTATASTTITEPAQLAIISASSTLVSCAGGSDGTIIINASGGVPPLMYSLNSGTPQLANTFSNQSAGNNAVLVEDANGCQNTINVQVLEPPALLINTITSTPESCLGNDGTTTVSVSGGTTGYTYLWQPSGQTTATATGLSSGNHAVLVTDANACTITASTIVDPPTLITLGTSTTNVSCFGGADGTATVAASGGTSGYTYIWSDTQSQTNATATGLNQGAYTVTVLDQIGCSASTAVVLTEPTVLSASVTGSNLTCFNSSNGTATATGAGGTPPYDYLWNYGNTTATVTGLSAGICTVTITDANTCTATASVQLTEPPLLSITSTSSNSVSCFGGNDGIIIVAVSGGNIPYLYSINNGTLQGSSTFNGQAAGNYTVQVQDANGCLATSSVQVTEPPVLALDAISSTAESCLGNDGTATVVISGGTPNYSYLWLPSNQTTASATGLATGTYTVLVTDDKACTLTASTQVGAPTAVTLSTTMMGVSCFGGNDGTATATASGGTGGFTYQWGTNAGNQGTQMASNLSAGTYFVTATDMSGCNAVESIIVTQPNALFHNFTSTNISCFGGNDGEVTATASGGTPPYQYQWGIASGNQITMTATGLFAGLHLVTITDAESCILTASITLTQPSTALSATTATVDASCNGGMDGSATVIATGGTAGYSYLWNDPNSQTGATATGLLAGMYQVLVTDQNGCTTTQNATITEPSAITVSLSQQSTSCNAGMDGTATVTAFGGTGTFTYLWSDGQVTSTAINLQGGLQYFVTVFDANSCPETGSILIQQPTALAISFNTQNPGCFAGNDGTATAVPTGGTPPYSYAWGANANNQGTAQATMLSPGLYEVVVTDNLGCTATASVTLNQNTPVSVNTSGQDIDCFGALTGTASVNAQGGTAPYQYQWNDPAGQTTTTATNLGAGTYQVAVTDTQGCTQTANITLSEPAQALSATSEAEEISCFGREDGAIQVIGAGGTPPYQYSLDGINFSGTDYFIGLDDGAYSIYVQDNKGCATQFSETVVEPPELTVELGEDVIIEYGEEHILNPITTPLGSYTYEWTTLSPDLFLSCRDCEFPVATPEYDINYTVLVTNENGCRAEDDVTIVVEKIRRVFLPTGFSPNADGFNDFFYVQGGEGTEAVQLFRIYDRWGELVFERRETELNNPEKGWDGTFRGKAMNSNVFVWTALVRFTDGATILYKGDVSLLR